MPVPDWRRRQLSWQLASPCTPGTSRGWGNAHRRARVGPRRLDGRERHSVSHTFHPSTTTPEKWLLSPLPPLPSRYASGPATRASRGARCALASRGSRELLAQSRFGEKEALSATDRARRRARSVDACGLDPSDRPISTLADLRRLILVFQVAFRGETSGLKRGKAVKVRQNPTSTPAIPVPQLAFDRPASSARADSSTPLSPPSSGRRRQHRHRG